VCFGGWVFFVCESVFGRRKLLLRL
jgi:hypothetical protein